MAVVAPDVLDPKGRILPELFPAEDTAALTARVEGWISQGAADPRISALTEPDAATVAFVYYRAFSAVCDRLNVQAARLDFADQGSRTMLKEQLAYWATERDRAETDLLAAIAAGEAEVDGEAPIVGAPLPSSYSAVQFTF